MRFSAALLLPVLLATSVSGKNAKSIIKDLATILADLKTLNATVNTFLPGQVLGVTTALQIQQETKNLGAALDQAISDAKKAKPINQKKSGIIGAAVLNLVDPINSTLNNIIAHKASFQSGFLIIGDLSATVEATLLSEQNQTATLGAALGPKLASPFSDLAPIITAELVDLFNPAIKQFKMCGNILCLPPI